MIGHLRGRVLEPGIIETSDGVGYAVTVSTDLNPGDEVSLRIVTTVRETDISLWGFPTLDDELVFRALMGVPSVGPTAAMATVRALGGPGLVAAVEAGDVGAFKPVPGVGAVTAKRIITSIKLPEGVAAAKSRASSEVIADVAKALQGLGYPSDVATKVAGEVAEGRPDATTGELVTLATVELASRAGGAA